MPRKGGTSNSPYFCPEESPTARANFGAWPETLVVVMRAFLCSHQEIRKKDLNPHSLISVGGSLGDSPEEPADVNPGL